MVQTKELNNAVYQLIYGGCMRIFKRNVLRYPTLDTVLMIESKITKAKSDKNVREIWLSLPKKVMWQTYLATLDYLEYSGKIIIDSDKHVLWIWAPREIDALKKKGLAVR